MSSCKQRNQYRFKNYLGLKVLIFIHLYGSSLGELNFGDKCFNAAQYQGTCVHLSNCESALKLIDNHKSPHFCNSGTEDNFNALVCCVNNVEALQNENQYNTISHAMCMKYLPKLFGPDNEEGFFHVAVVHGRKSLAKEYPHMALLGYGDNLQDIEWLCGGSLISDKFILTAAHCITSRYGAPTWVRLGELDTEDTRDDADPKDFKVLRSIAHPDYKIQFVYHDIGILELDKTVKFTEYIRPACIYQGGDLSKYNMASASGWGTTSFGEKNSNHLRTANLVFVNHTKCNQFYRKSAKNMLPRGILDDSQICAGGNEGKDTCQGDSGGPLQVIKPESKKKKNTNGNCYDIIGITSFGSLCGLENIPGIYTRVSAYREWIENIVWP
ncbi:serine protease snake-like [Anthonomus grandis grandis]|uniref:serine protease snake-like n=1 Tax=Anthonomus grandis grandis TaxID=2921223 RepID=UPI002165FCAF|nr:serine protease snake-like [Anthonomus grandis grandis]XP_050304375.1 serine protease snake-like [Anthonomus grandis grandis]